MKKITIYQENNEPIILYDGDVDETITNIEYENNIENIMSYSNICKLTMNDNTVFLKPSKIDSIIIDHNYQNNNEIVLKPKKTKKKNKEKIKKIEEKPEVTIDNKSELEDVITDI